MAEAEEYHFLSAEILLLEKTLLVNRCRQAFAEHFERPDDGPFHFVVVPARLFLIGEYALAHDDRTVAMAMPYYLVAYGRRRTSNDKLSMMYDCLSQTMYEIRQPYSDKRPDEPSWVRSARAILALVMVTIDMDLVFATSMLDGAIMGKDAAVELCVLLLQRRFTAHLRPASSVLLMTECVRLCWEAELRYFGTIFNAVDLVVQTTTKKDNFLLLEAEPFSAESNAVINVVPIEFHGMKDVTLILIDSGISRLNLVTRMYEISGKLHETANYLRTQNLETAERDSIINSLTGWMRDIATHMLDEAERTDQALTALLDDNYYLLGKLLTESHNSSRDLLKISCPELDRIVDLSLEVSGVYGSRMAGCGFGGFVITVVERESIRNLVEHIKANYNGDATFRECLPVDSILVYSTE